MKTLKRLLFLCSVAVFLCAGSARAQLTTACQYSTCVPKINFTNTDNLQIYGAILAGNGAGSVTVVQGSVVVSSGSITVTSGSMVVTSGSVVMTSGNVGGFTTKYTRTVTTDGAYAIGDCVGGVLTFTNIFRVGQASGVLEDIEIYDNAAQNAVLVLDFWLASPAGTYNNNSPTVLGDPANYQGSVLVSASDYITTGTKSRACLKGVGLTLLGASEVAVTRNLWVTITTNGTPTYAAGSDALYIKLGILQD